uniref:Protein kinase domain-containing protein n=1 Tax=viral metagenome TaxID=1070528 RepID=A0A6C0H1N6_9ZZZZ
MSSTPTPTPKVIGEGSYGCVHAPRLKCKNNDDKYPYENKISKLLTIENGKTELSEYNNIQVADINNEFHLGKPSSCAIDEISTRNINAIKKCSKGHEMIKSLSKYGLIIMDDGGMNVKDYSDKMSELSISPENTKKCELFLLESLRLFHGLLLFQKKGLIHFDLKPQNIVYDEVKNRLNFIDFGLMTKKSDISPTSCIFHWSYPWETELLYYEVFIKTKANRVNNMRKDVSEKGKNHSHFFHFFNHCIDKSLPSSEYSKCVTNFFEEHNRFVTQTDFTKRDVYIKFIHACLDTVDIYGLGIAMMYWLNHVKKHIDPILFGKLNELFRSMISTNVWERKTVLNATVSLERIIDESGILKNHNKSVLNHMMVDGTGDISIVKPMDMKMAKSFKPNPVFLEMEPGACPEGKERNPKTRRCINKCKPGYSRDANFKCVKDKKNRVVKPKKSIPQCPEGKERNPKTRRCINKCKPGYSRDANFKCVSNKTKKNIESLSGKPIRAPKTPSFIPVFSE